MNEKLKKELLKNRKTSLYPYLVHINNEDFGDFYFTDYYNSVTYDEKTYESANFQITPSERTQSGIGNAQFSFSVVDQKWIEKIRNTQKRSTINVISVIIYDDNTVEPIEENNFVLTSINWDESSAIWDMVFDDRMDILIPCDVINGLNCPGCV